MSEASLAGLGIASAVVNTIGLVPYLRDIFRHKTKPERATWWIWLALGLIAFFAQLAAGARWSTLLTAASILAVGTIAVLSLRYGYGTFRRKDFIALSIALIGVVLWQLTDAPLIALLIVIAIDGIGYSLTLLKSWKAPNTETLSSWLLATIATALSVLAVGDWDFTKLIYPVFLFLTNSVLVWILVYRRSILVQNRENTNV